MIRRIWGQLALAMVAVSILSVFVISLVLNGWTQRNFQNYLNDSQKKQIDELVNLLQREYALHGQWSANFLQSLEGYVSIEGFGLRLRDDQGNILWLLHGRGMMMGQGQGRGGMFWDGGALAPESHNIVVDKATVGTLEVGYPGKAGLSLQAAQYQSTQLQAFLWSGILTALAAICISWVVSRRLTAPVEFMTRMAYRIQEGDWKERIPVKFSSVELNGMASAINHMAQSVERQESLRKRLTGDIAHEIRTPLSTLQSHLEAFMDGVWEPTGERLASCYEEIQRLTRLIGDMETLNLYENMEDRIERKKVNVSLLVERTMEDFQSRYQEKGVLLTGEIIPELHMKGDSDKLKQLFINLLSNGLKYTDKGGEVKVRVQPEEKGILMEIEDNGAGIPKEDLPYVFERFYRGDKSRSRTTGGAGIGLTIAKAVAEAHGGTIEVSSELGKGTIFHVRFPYPLEKTGQKEKQ